MCEGKAAVEQHSEAVAVSSWSVGELLLNRLSTLAFHLDFSFEANITLALAHDRHAYTDQETCWHEVIAVYTCAGTARPGFMLQCITCHTQSHSGPGFLEDTEAAIVFALSMQVAQHCSRWLSQQRH